MKMNKMVNKNSKKSNLGMVTQWKMRAGKDRRCSTWWKRGSSMADMGGALCVCVCVGRGCRGEDCWCFAWGYKDQFAVGELVDGRRGRCSTWEVSPSVVRGGGWEKSKGWFTGNGARQQQVWWSGGAKTSSLKGGVVNCKRGRVGRQRLVYWKGSCWR